MDISETIKFRDICTMMEKVKNASNGAAKEKYLRRYYESFKKHRMAFRSQKEIAESEENGDTSFYCILRCLIPQTDNVRKAYGLQINALGKVYIKVLQLPPDSRDAKRLKANTYSGIHGDYADIVYSVLTSRCKRELSNLTLKEIHEMLDTIASDSRPNTEKVLTRLSDVASAQEQMWFIRLVLKSMRLGIGEQRIFTMLHPQARELYQRCTNLKRVCAVIADNKIEELNANGAGGGDQLMLNAAIEPFQHVQPMLCQVFPGNIAPLMAADVLYMETKMDGERFQLHYADGRFKYISRNGIDYTYSFGDSYNTGNLTPHLSNLLPIGMQSIILDGEMMVWDVVQGKFRVKGENTDVKHLSSERSWRPCFVAYDILHLNGQNLLDVPYAQRSHKLREIIKEQQGVLHTMKPIKVTSLDKFQSLYQQALDANEEGVVLKKQNSIYRPGVRYGGGWYKVKADYIEGLTTEFDVLIIGGFYNRTRTFIESFLVGVLKQNSPQDHEVYSIGKVTNITQQRKVLNATLKPHWHPLTAEPPPMWYHYVANNTEGSPDVWIEPKNSIILQIKAADLAPSANFALSKSLHFPRIELWRNDKSWSECMTLNDFMQMAQGARGVKKINKRGLSMNDFTSERKKAKLTPAEKRKLGMLAYEKRFDPKDVTQTSDFLKGFSFCILSATLEQGYAEEDLKALVVRNGGEIVENPIYQDSTCINVAGDITFRVETIQKAKRYDVASMDWLLRICEQQKIQIKPNDMVSMTDALKEQFLQSYDKYGDSYTEDIDADELKMIFDRIPEHDIEVLTISNSSYEQLEKMMYGENIFNYFRNCYAYFYEQDDAEQQSSMKQTLEKLLFQWHGGNCIDIIDHRQLDSINYIFINPKRIVAQSFRSWLKHTLDAHLKHIKVVNSNWIVDSHHSQSMIDICEYTWHDF